MDIINRITEFTLPTKQENLVTKIAYPLRNFNIIPEFILRRQCSPYLIILLLLLLHHALIFSLIPRTFLLFYF